MAKTVATKAVSIVSVGSYSIKAVKCAVEDRKVRVLAWKTHKNALALTTQSPFDEYLHELGKALDSFKGTVFEDHERVHFMFSSSFMIVKILGVPGFAKSEFKSLIRDKLERDNAVSAKTGGLEAFQYVTAMFEGLNDADKIEEQMDVAVLTILAEKDVLVKFREFTAGYNLMVAGIWSEVAGTAGLIKFADPGAWKEQVAVVNVGHTLTTFQIFSEGKCLFYRPIFTAGQAITNDVLAITSDETIDFKQAEELKHKISLNPKAVESTSLTPLEALIHTISEQASLREFSLVRKLDISFEYLSVNLKKRIQKILYVGGTAGLEGLIEYITKNTTLPAGETLALKNLTTLDCPFPPEEGEDALLSYAPALGLAVSVSENLYGTLNMARTGGALSFLDLGQIKQVVSQYLARGLYVIEGILALYLVVAFSMTWWGNYEKISELRDKIDRSPKIQLPEGPEDIEELQELNETLRRPLTFYNKVLRTRRNWSDIFSGLARSIPNSEIRLLSVELEQEKIKEPEAKSKAAEGGGGGGDGGDGGGDAGGGMGGMGGVGAMGIPGAGGGASDSGSPSIEKFEYTLLLKGMTSDPTLVRRFVKSLESAGHFRSVRPNNVGTAGKSSSGTGGSASMGAGGMGGSLMGSGGGKGASKALPFEILIAF